MSMYSHFSHPRLHLDKHSEDEMYSNIPFFGEDIITLAYLAW